MGAHELLPLAVNGKSEGKVDSLPLLGLEPATFGTQARLSAKSHIRKRLPFLSIDHLCNLKCHQ
jgi:hypothetical protein